MLRNTFVHIPGVGSKTELALWSSGCLTWEDALSDKRKTSFGTVADAAALKHLEQSEAALSDGQHQFFAKSLGMPEAWRAWGEFSGRTVYLDIETDGGNSGDAITCIGLYDGAEFRCLVRDQDLAELPDVLSHYSMIVTFFGAGFDLPMIKKRWSFLEIDQIHLDLCPTMRKLGIQGGLKKIEKQLGLQRDEEAEGLNGLDAIRLWRQYERRGDVGALEKLIKYNREDVVNLERLAEHAYTLLHEQTIGPFVGSAR